MKTLVKKMVAAKPSYNIRCADIDSGISIANEECKNIFYLSVYGVQACCGASSMAELGAISSSALADDKAFTTTLDKAMHQLIDTAEDSEGCMALIANLIDNNACNLLKDSFKRTKLFSCVKTFTNMNSGNTIEIWLSNN